MRYGLFIPGKNKQVDDKNLQYDSRKPRMQIALGKDPTHLDLLSIPGGTALATTGGSAQTKSETLFSMTHKLPYQPKALVYFYVEGPSGTRYGLGKSFYAYGPINDYVGYSVTDTTFSIVHILEDPYGFSYTSGAPSHKLRIKYMILSIPENKRIQDV
jgi:hypothetical protein